MYIYICKCRVFRNFSSIKSFNNISLVEMAASVFSF